MKSEKGFSLIEVMIAIALLGIIGIAILGALATASRAMFVADERATAESLARSQIEYIKNQSYSTINVDWDYTVTDSGRSSSDAPDWWLDVSPSGNPPLLSSDYAGYSVEASADEDEANVGLQKITVIVKHDGTTIITLEGYKVDR
jgi:prepilin-type N-terminal cleavage/methylation domain-containing protein